jgi:hypothetical protein
MLATIVALLREQWGGAAALGALAFSIFSTGFNLFAPSLYWITFVHVAPAAILSLAVMLGARGRLAWMGVYFAVFVIFAVKFSSGYEFLTATAGGAVIPFLVLYGAGKIGHWTFLAHAAALFGTGVAAFAVCLAAYQFHFQATFHASGFAYLLSRSNEWGGALGEGAVGLLRNLSKVLLINSVDIGGYGVPNAVPVAAGGVSVLLAARALLLRRTEEASARIVLAIAGAFLVSIAWVALQPQHILFHPRYSSILLSYPFGLVLAAGGIRLLELTRAQRRLPS